MVSGYLAALGVLVDLIRRGEHAAVLTRGFRSTWSTWLPWIYTIGFGPQLPDAQHLIGSNRVNHKLSP